MLEYYKLRQNRIHRFQPKIEISSDRGPFTVKTINNSKELIEAFRLRYEVFHKEMIGRTKPTGLDVDEYDFLCDHLAIIDRKSGKIVGTYRLNCSLFSKNFYSAQEFNLRRILEQPGVKLELGRACIHKDYRRGAVIALLWRGIAEYMSATKAQFLFGCASIKTQSPLKLPFCILTLQKPIAFKSNSFVRRRNPIPFRSSLYGLIVFQMN